MATITFIAREGKKKLSIYLLCYFNKKKLRYNTKIKVKPTEWIAEKQRTKSGMKNNELLELEKKANDIIELARIENSYLDEKIFALKMGSGEKETGFFQVYDEFVKAKKAEVSSGTITTYNVTKEKLLKFQKETKFLIAFNTINLTFYDKLITYLHDQNHLNSYTGKVVNILKRVMQWSFERGYHSNLEFKKFKEANYENQIIYLTEEELNILIEKDLSNEPKLERVRDMFILGCSTGLRLSDLSKLNKTNIFPDYIKITTQKTKEQDLIIPLNKYSKNIINKYINNDSFLGSISSQKYNDYLKVVCMRAELNDMVNVVKYSGSKRIEKKVPKHDLITSHVARKTFITLSKLKGIDDDTIMKVSGIKKHATLDVYKKITDEWIFEQMKKF